MHLGGSKDKHFSCFHSSCHLGLRLRIVAPSPCSFLGPEICEIYFLSFPQKYINLGIFSLESFISFAFCLKILLLFEGLNNFLFLNDHKKNLSLSNQQIAGLLTALSPWDWSIILILKPSFDMALFVDLWFSPIFPSLLWS